MEQINNRNTHFFDIKDDNISALREKHPQGLTFVIGDTHGQPQTLKALIEKIRFDAEKDFAYFVGDYNDGYNVRSLLSYMSLYYQPDCKKPGFHMIRGNHEREMFPYYALSDLPDIIVLKREKAAFFIAHAGMVRPLFSLLCRDLHENPTETVFAYRLDENCTRHRCLLRQATWSYNGLYSQKGKRPIWPAFSDLVRENACIIHGHSPYCFFTKGDSVSYGDNNVFWKSQHMIFSEDLQGFNIDSNIKGRMRNSQTYRGISAVCLDVIEEIKKDKAPLTCADIMQSENFSFGCEITYSDNITEYGDINVILSASPVMKTISVDDEGKPFIVC